MAITNFYTRGKEAGQAKSLVILLHGVGSNGQDLISLAPYYTQYVPDAAFVSPDAPFTCDMVPPGYPNSYQWFSLMDRDPHKMLEGVKTVMPLVESFIDEQLEAYGLTHDRLVMLGFSQGTMTSLHVAPRLKKKIAGVLGYSGALLWEESMSSENLQKMPVHLIHGEDDDVVPVEAWSAAKNVLISNNYEFSGYTQPRLPHSIDEKGIESGGEFLKKVLI